MANVLRMRLVIVVSALALAACSGETGLLSEQQVLDAANEQQVRDTA